MGLENIDRARPIEFLAGLWRRRAFPLAGALLGLMVAGLFLLLTPYRYVAVAQLLIDPTDLRVVENAVTSPNALGDSTVALVESQVRVLTSDNVLRKVVETQGLDQDPEFTGSGLGAMVGLGPALARGDPSHVALRALEQVVSARRQERTYVVDLAVTTGNAEKSVSITNAIVNAYIEDQAAARSQAARRATSALSSRLQELKDRVREADEAVEKYKGQHDLIGASGQLVKEQQLSELNSQLILAQARTAEAKARNEQIERLQRSGADPGAIAEAVQSPTVATLRAQYAEAVRREAELNARLGTRHPFLVDIKAQTRNLHQQISAEIARLARAARGDYDRALANQEALERSLDALKREAVAASQAFVRLRELEREAEASRAVYQAFLVRSRETSEQERLNAANVRVLSEATFPPRRSWPPRAMFVMAAGLLFGAAAGAGLAFARERGDGLIRSRRDLAATCELPILAEITGLGGRIGRPRGATRFLPKGGGADAPGTDPLQTVVDAPGSAFAAGIARLSHVLRALAPAKTGRTILLLAAGAPGARPEVALNLALALAASKSSVLLVDTDLEGRALTSLLGGKSGAGLIDVAYHRVGFQDALLSEPSTGLLVMRARKPETHRGHADPEEIVKVLENAKSFETVVLDGPADGFDPLTRALAEFVDVAVLVVTAGTTRSRDIAGFLAVADATAGKIRGVVLVTSDPRTA